jgi:adenosylcobinamide-phosphate synthase
MAAMALALGVHLGKPGVYVLNATGRDVVSNDVFSAVKLASNTLLTQVITAQAAIFLIAL